MNTRLYYMDDCTVALPPGFRDNTVNVLEWKTDEDDSIALVVQRETLDEAAFMEPNSPAIALAAFVDEGTKDYASRFSGFRLERDDVAIGHPSGAEMTRKAWRWNKGQDVIYQHQVFVFAAPLLVVFTGAAKARHRERVDYVVEQALTTLRHRHD